MLADMATRIEQARLITYRAAKYAMAGHPDTAKYSAMAKYAASETAVAVANDALQLHGGYGYMWESPITRAWADARVQRVYGGTNELMKELISRTL